MRELGIDLAEVRQFFDEESDEPFLLIKVPESATAKWASMLDVPVRRCYLSDETLSGRAQTTGASERTIVQAKLPDRGSVMAGDFGEIVAALYLATSELPADVRDPKKWRLKQDRTKPVPHSDVVQFVLPEWPSPSDRDKLICAEVKTKSTRGNSAPIANAIAHSRKDREGRLVKTLVWLRDRALIEDLGTVSIDVLNRFIQATDHPVAAREFRAVVVLCSSLVAAETLGVTGPPPEETTLIVISVPDLKSNYEAVYDAVMASVD